MKHNRHRSFFCSIVFALTLGASAACAQTHSAHSAEKRTAGAHASGAQGHASKSASAQSDGKLGAVRVAGVRVAGLTPEQARKKIAQALRGKLNSKIRMTDGIKSVGVARKDLGIALDVEEMIGAAEQGKKTVGLKFTVDREKLQKALRKTAPKFESAGRNAHPVLQHGQIQIVKGEDSRTVNAAKSAQALADRIEKNAALSTLPLILDKKPPRFDVAQLKGITSRLCQFSTRYNSSSAKRSHNIRTAVKRIDGQVLEPGDVFSLNKTVGERTHAHGFLTAPVIENQQLTEGIGGGVSQVTGTLFNAALLAGLPIVEYGAHSEPVPYLPVGRDATVAWEHIDLRFKNTTEAPIYIEYKASNGRCAAALYGASSSGRQVSLSVTSKKLGPHHISADLFRTFKKNGQVLRKEKIGHADYNWKPKESSD